jgi:hypothetical protein
MITELPSRFLPSVLDYELNSTPSITFTLKAILLSATPLSLPDHVIEGDEDII